MCACQEVGAAAVLYSPDSQGDLGRVPLSSALLSLNIPNYKFIRGGESCSEKSIGRTDVVMLANSSWLAAEGIHFKLLLHLLIENFILPVSQVLLDENYNLPWVVVGFKTVILDLWDHEIIDKLPWLVMYLHCLT